MVWADASEGTEEAMIVGDVKCPLCGRVRSPDFEGNQVKCECHDCGINFAIQVKGRGGIVFQEERAKFYFIPAEPIAYPPPT